MKRLIAAVSLALAASSAFADAMDPFLTDPVMPARSEGASGTPAVGVELPVLKYWDPA